MDTINGFRLRYSLFKLSSWVLLSVLAVSSGEKFMAELKHGLKFPSSNHGEPKYLSLLLGSLPQPNQVLLPSVTQMFHLTSDLELSGTRPGLEEVLGLYYCDHSVGTLIFKFSPASSVFPMIMWGLPNL